MKDKQWADWAKRFAMAVCHFEPGFETGGADMACFNGSQQWPLEMMRELCEMVEEAGLLYELVVPTLTGKRLQQLHSAAQSRAPSRAPAAPKRPARRRAGK